MFEARAKSILPVAGKGTVNFDSPCGKIVPFELDWQRHIDGIQKERGAMSAFLIAHLNVTDPTAFEDYRAAVPDVIARFGGRYLVRGGAVEVLEGEWRVPRLVILAFDSMDRAKQFYHSTEYQEILPLRLAAAKGDVVLIEGASGAP